MSLDTNDAYPEQPESIEPVNPDLDNDAAETDGEPLADDASESVDTDGE
jgi:hypothetical protein